MSSRPSPSVPPRVTVTIANPKGNTEAIMVRTAPGANPSGVVLEPGQECTVALGAHQVTSIVSLPSVE